MATIYKKNGLGVYTIPIYKKFYFWFILLIILALFLTGINKYVKFINITSYVLIFWSFILILWILKLIKLIIDIINNKGFKNYRINKKFEKQITKSLLATMMLNRLKDSPFISVPNVKVGNSLPSHIEINIEKLAGMYDVEKLTEDITSSFRNKYSNFVVTSSMISNDGNYYNFILEDVGSDKTWIPKSFEDLSKKPYIVPLQKNLIVNLSEKPHIAIWGKTGSKKSTTILGIVLNLFSNGSDVRFLDFKDEYSSFTLFYPEDKIINEIEDVQPLLDNILFEIKERQVIITNKAKELGKMGLRASDVGLTPLVLIADEVGSLVSLMDSKQQKKFIASLVAIIQRGRSVGVNLIVGTQSPAVDVLPQSIRSNFSTKILLGSANSETQRMAFGEVATRGNVEDFKGYYTCDGLTIQPMKFYVNNIYKYGFNNLEKFEKAYKIGLKIKENEVK